MPYASASDVGALCHNLLDSESSFSATTAPTLTDIESWLSSGCSIIEAQLGSWGYTTPVANTAGIFPWLTELNALWAAARAELSRTNITIGPGERTRGQVFEKMFWDGMRQLKEMDLTAGGVNRSSARASIYGGGISKIDKDGQESDSDRVAPRFKRGQFTVWTSTPLEHEEDNDEDYD